MVIFGFAHETEDYMTLVRREEILEDTDQDGIYELDLGRPVPFASVWVAIDLATGESAFAAPEGLPVRELSIAPKLIPATLDRLDVPLSMAEVLLVRPATGAWGLRVGDGGASDEDGSQDGTLRAALASLWSVGDSPAPPGKVATGDVVVVLEPQTLNLLIVRLGA